MGRQVSPCFRFPTLCLSLFFLILVRDVHYRGHLTLIDIFPVAELTLIYWNMVELSSVPDSSVEPKVMLFDHNLKVRRDPF